MYNFLILLAVIPILLGNPVPIVGGRKARLIPYQVSIGRYGHSCGGSIVSNRIIITAAHCVKPNMTSSWVRAGSRTRNQEGQQVHISDYAIHPSYNNTTYDYDVAVLYLKSSLQFNKKVSSIPMANANDSLEPGTMALISGWGYNKEDAKKGTKKLMFAELPLVDDKTCKTTMFNWTDSRICAGYRMGIIGVCTGDSGGPLVVRGQLFGVASSTMGCARPSLYGIFISIPVVRLWIDEAISILENRNSRENTTLNMYN